MARKKRKSKKVYRKPKVAKAKKFIPKTTRRPQPLSNYSFPEYGISIQARDKEEAHRLLKEKIEGR